MTPSVYINLEDDVSKIVARLRHVTQPQVVLVCPKRCFLFSDGINLKLLKKQTDLLGKEVSILTMDENGQAFAREAGFELKFVPKAGGSSAFSDVRVNRPVQPRPVLEPQPEPEPEPQQARQPAGLADRVKGIGQIAKKLVPGSVLNSNNEPKVSSQVVSLAALETVPEVTVSDNIFPPGEEDILVEKQDKSHTQKLVTGLVTVCVILILVLAFVVLPKATVVIYPKTEPVTRDMTISLSGNAKSVDINQLILPAQKVDESVSVSDKFESQGKTEVGNKADGTVKIYNFTKVPISLKAATTILVVGTQTYNLVNDVVNLRPTTYLNAKTKEVDPSSLGDSVEVTATSGGDEYNLPAGTRMEITNQVFGSRPQLLYAKSDTEIAGGTTRYLSVISQDDVTAAQAQLQNEALQQVQQKLQSSGQVLADGAYSITVSQFTTDNPVGTQTPSFNASLNAQISGLSFGGDDLQNLVQQRISQSLASNQTLVQEASTTQYSAVNLDMTSQLATLNLHYQGDAVMGLDLSPIPAELTGKSQGQASELLASMPAVDKVNITLAPAWQKTFPFFASKINVTEAQPQ